MLQIRHIDKTFGRITALRDINLHIPAGEFFGLLGPNGAGKTTLMNIIIGYIKSDAGSVTLDNEMLSYESIQLRNKIGYVPQEIALFKELSAIQNLKIFGSLYGLSGANLNRKIDEALELVSLEDRMKDKVKDFSGGMKRRLNIAASILHDPALILCDEPTVGVDPQSRNAIFNMLKELNNRGKTVVYTTHYMEEAERLCTNLAIIDSGKIIAEGKLNELIDILNQKASIKINKINRIASNKEIIETLGKVIEHESFFEIVPDAKFGKISEVFQEIERIGLPEESVTLSRASLEDVFLHLTGRSLRD